MSRPSVACLALLAALLPAAAGGCASSAQRPGGTYFDAGHAAYARGQWQAAADDFTRYLQIYPSSPHRAEAYYYRGNARVHLGRRADALADFQRAVVAEPHPAIRSLAHVALGNLYFEGGHDREAVRAYAEALKAPPPETPLERVLLRLAISLQRLGKWTQADRYLAWVIENHASTGAATEARRRYRAAAFAVQTGAYASSAGARREALRLRQAGFRPRIAARRTGAGRPLHAVHVGQVGTYAEAAALARRVHEAGFAAMVVP